MINDQGIILINKDIGKSSGKVVAELRRLAGMKRVGHCGTLDPFASGVLPIVIGRATAAVPYMSEYNKRYRCQIQLGAKTDSMDRDGDIIKRATADFNLDSLISSDIETVLSEFEGRIRQQAPLYSAVKVAGKALYKYARKGESVERPWREVEVYEIKLLNIYFVDGEIFPRLDISFHVSKGTYIRSLADAIGERLGCFAYAAELERTECGPFNIDQCVSTDELFERFNAVDRNSKELLQLLKSKGVLLPTMAAFTDFPVYKLDPGEARDLAQGKVSFDLDSELCHETMAFSFNDLLIAVGRVESGKIVLKRVFVDSGLNFSNGDSDCADL